MRRLALLALALLVAAAPAAAQDPQIAAGDVQPHLEQLQSIADANGGNRVAGLPGANATADYIAAELERAGWQVRRQPVRFPFFDLRAPPRLHDLKPGRDFVAIRYSGSGDVSGRLRLTRAGSCGPRDFRAVRPGDVVLAPYAACTWSEAARRVKREGGVALLGVTSSDPYPLTSVALVPGLPLPVLGLSDPAARRLWRLRRNRPVRVTVDAPIGPRSADNVIAELPGSAAGGRVLMAGGHLDSVFEGPGINDNASGIAALLEVAERIAAAPRGRATMRLGFWTAEEHGLFGSRHYVRTLSPQERRRTAGYVNLDMVGSPNAVPEVYSSGNALSRALRRRIRGAGSTSYRREDSDHEAFVRAGIPVSGIYTGGLENKTRAQRRRWGGRPGPRDRCYHRRCDTAGNADAAMTARMAAATAGALLELGR